MLAAVALLVAVVVLLWLALSPDADPSAPSPGETDSPTDVVRTDGAETEPGAAAATAETQRPTQPLQRTGDGRIGGTLRRADDQSPLAGVTVRLHAGGSATATTDAEGRFTFDELDRRSTFTLDVDVTGVGRLLRTGLVIGRRGRLELGDLFLAPPARVEVSVVDTRGEPLQGARVHGFTVGTGAPEFLDRRDPEPTATAATGADGVATFAGLSTGSWTFVATKPRYARAATGEVQVRPATETRRFQLTLGGAEALTGRVLDADGSPVPRARVVGLRRTIYHDATAAPLALRTYTDALGRYRFDSLPRGDTVLWVAPPGQDLQVVAAVRKPGVTEYDLVLPPATWVEGVVADAQTGDPLAAVRLRATFRTPLGVVLYPTAETDELGRYSIDLPGPGTLDSLTADAQGYVPRDLERSHRVGPGEAVEVDLALTRGVPVSGVVLADAGPVPGALIEMAQTAGDFHATLATDARGAFHLDAVPEGELFVAVTHLGLRTTSRSSARMDVRRGAANEVELRLTTGPALTGIVTDPEGRPLEGAQVWIDGDTSGWRATTDAQGRYRIPSVTSNDELLVVFDHPRHVEAVRNVRMGDLDRELPAAALQARTRIRGRMVSATGEALRDAYLQVAGISGGTRPHPTQEEWQWLSFERLPVRPDGTFDHLVPVSDSHFLVRAVAADHAPTVTAPQPLAAAEEPLSLTLDVGHELRGIVLGPDGGPAVGASVALVGCAPGEAASEVEYVGALGPPVVATTDASGAFRVEHLPEGHYAVRAWRPGGRPVATSVSLPSSGTFTLRLAD